MGTSYEPPKSPPKTLKEEIEAQKFEPYVPPKTQEERDKMDREHQEAADLMLRTLEEQMTAGRKDGMPSNSIDMMMSQISQVSANMIMGRKEILRKADAQKQAKIDEENKINQE